MERPWLNHYDEAVHHTFKVPDLTLDEMFYNSVASRPDAAAVSYFGQRISYRELQRKIEQFAKALHWLGVAKGDKVALMLPNIPQYLIAHFALLHLGAIIVPTNPLYVERELKYQLNNSEAETIIALDFHLNKIRNIRSETRLKNIILTRVHEYLPFHLRMIYPIKARIQGRWFKMKSEPGIHLFRNLMGEPFQFELTDTPKAPEDIAMFLYSGGTTGISKGAILTHRNLVVNVHQVRHWYGALKEGEEVSLCVLPFFHSYGLTTCLHLSVLIKGKMVLIPNPREIEALLKAIQKERVTLFSGVPTMYIAVNNFPGIEKYDLSSIKACVSGGAPLPLDVAKEFERISGGILVEGYGLSETSPVTHTNPIYGKRKEGSIGLPVSGTDAKIVNPDTKEALQPGQIGELAVKGPQVMQGYWKMEDETSDILRGDWLYTGDIAKMDKDGYFYIVDRKKDMIIASGFNIFPREIEEVLFEHPKILEAAVIGIPDEYRGETVKAFIVSKEQMDAEEIIAYCKDKLTAYKIPKVIEFRSELPKSNIGKVLRRVLKDSETAARKHIS